MKYMRNGRGSRNGGKGGRKRRELDEPLSGVANLFDVAMVFALGMMVMVLLAGVTEQTMKVEEIEKTETKEKVEVPIKEMVGVVYETPDGGWLLVREDETIKLP